MWLMPSSLKNDSSFEEMRSAAIGSEASFDERESFVTMLTGDGAYLAKAQAAPREGAAAARTIKPRRLRR